MLNKGSSSVIDVKNGSTQINSVYKGSSLVWANLDNIVNNVTLKVSGNSSSSYTLTCDKKGLYAVILCNQQDMSRSASSSVSTTGTIVANYGAAGARVALVQCNSGNTITKGGSGNKYNYYYIWYIGDVKCTIDTYRTLSNDGSTSGTMSLATNQIGLFLFSIPSNNLGWGTSGSITLTNAKISKTLINNNAVGLYAFNSSDTASFPWRTSGGDWSTTACLTAKCTIW